MLMLNSILGYKFSNDCLKLYRTTDEKMVDTHTHTHTHTHVYNIIYHQLATGDAMTQK
jgi:hypothetical protein